MSELIAEIYCPSCGYDLRGIDSPRCPECGIIIDRELIARSIIPWTHRNEIGRWRAFCKTVWFILRNPRGMGRDVMRAVSYPDAQHFRWLVVLWAWIPLAAIVLVTRAWIGDIAGPGFSLSWRGLIISPWIDPGICLWLGYFIWPVPAVALFLLLAGVTGAPAWFYRPPSLEIKRQNRAVAISFYACAPLAILCLPLILLGGGLFASERIYSPHDQFWFRTTAILYVMGGTILLAIPIVFLVRALHLLQATTQCTAGRIFATAVSLPLSWLIIVVLALGVFPAWCGLIKLMFLTYLF